MNSYAWAITRDLLHEQDPTTMCRVGVIGPRQSSFWDDRPVRGYEKVVDHVDRRKFELYDSDGIVYYEGYLVGGRGYEPLDDFGMPDSGCTGIRWSNEA
jgi:hypothetical protein